jgi:uncharacterized protein
MKIAKAVLATMIFVVIAACAPGLKAVAPVDAAGTWIGILDDHGVKQRTVFTIEAKADGGLYGSVASPDQSPVIFPCSSVVLAGNKLSVESKILAFLCVGEIKENGALGDATFTQHGQSCLLPSKRMAAPKPRPQDPKKPYSYREEEETDRIEKAGFNLAGTWQGLLQASGQKAVSIVFKLARNADQSWRGSLDIPEQGAKDIPCSTVSCMAGSITIEVKLAGLTLSGQLQADGQTMSVMLSQRGYQFPMTLRRTADSSATETVRLGTDAQVDTSKGILYGSLLVPDKPAGKTVVLIIAGSGPTDRDGNSTLLPGPGNPLRMLAQALAQNGIASLRFDKRGVGQSILAMSAEADLRFDDYIADVLSWLSWLQQDKRFNRIGVVGHSEGSLIGMIAAARGHADFYVSLAGTGRSIDQVLLEQLAPQSKKLHNTAKEYFAKLKMGRTIADVPPDPGIQSLFRPSIQPYFISWLKYDPALEIKKLNVPVLIVQGTTDLQVSLTDAKLLQQAKPDARSAIIKGMNHVLKLAPTAPAENVRTYSDPSVPLAPELITALADFIK